MRFRKPRGALRLIIFLCETVVESAILTLGFWQQPPQLPGSSLRSTRAHASEYTKNPDSDAPTGPETPAGTFESAATERARRPVVTLGARKPAPWRPDVGGTHPWWAFHDVTEGRVAGFTLSSCWKRFLQCAIKMLEICGKCWYAKAVTLTVPAFTLY